MGGGGHLFLGKEVRWYTPPQTNDVIWYVLEYFLLKFYFIIYYNEAENKVSAENHG